MQDYLPGVLYDILGESNLKQLEGKGISLDAEIFI